MLQATNTEQVSPIKFIKRPEMQTPLGSTQKLVHGQRDTAVQRNISGMMDSQFPVCLNLFKGFTTCCLCVYAYVCFIQPSQIFPGSPPWCTGAKSISFPALLHPVYSASCNPASSPQNIQTYRNQTEQGKSSLLIFESYLVWVSRI